MSGDLEALTALLRRGAKMHFDHAALLEEHFKGDDRNIVSTGLRKLAEQMLTSADSVETFALNERRKVRVETLRGLADYPKQGIELTAAALEEMAVEVERATEPVG